MKNKPRKLRVEVDNEEQARALVALKEVTADRDYWKTRCESKSNQVDSLILHNRELNEKVASLDRDKWRLTDLTLAKEIEVKEILLNVIRWQINPETAKPNAQ